MLAAATAVIAVVVATVAVRSVKDDDQPPVSGTATSPATTATPKAPATANDTPPPLEIPPVTLAPPGKPLDVCRDVMKGREGPLPGKNAEVVASMTGRWGTSLILTDGRVWAGCDTSGYHPSLRQPERVRVPAVTDNDAFAVSGYAQSVDWQPASKWYEYYWAAGILPDGVAKVVYSFPDGKSSVAKVTGRYWLMQHAYSEPLKEGVAHTERIRVRLERADGSVIRTFRLVWIKQTCAAISHGC